MILFGDTRLPAKFWARVQVSLSGCWLWQGFTERGYGKYYQKPFKTRWAHRIAYAVLVGDIPGGLHIDHVCRQRGCVNPEHLEPVTCRENLLRGNGWSGLNVRRTHCPRGHPLVGDNLEPYQLRRGRRECMLCSRERARKRKHSL